VGIIPRRAGAKRSGSECGKQKGEETNKPGNLSQSKEKVRNREKKRPGGVGYKGKSAINLYLKQCDIKFPPEICLALGSQRYYGETGQTDIIRHTRERNGKPKVEQGNASKWKITEEKKRHGIGMGKNGKRENKEDLLQITDTSPQEQKELKAVKKKGDD